MSTQAQKTMDQSQEYCTCGVWVAPHDPEKVVANGRRHHRRCLRQPKATELNCHVRIPNKLVPSYQV